MKVTRGQWSSMLVFAVSVLALAGLEAARAGHISVHGVGEATSFAHLAPELPWTVTVSEVLVREGQRVRAGDPLLRLSRGPMDAALRAQRGEVARIVRESRALRRELGAASAPSAPSGDARSTEADDPTGAAELEVLAALRADDLPAAALGRLRAVQEALVSAREQARRYDDASRALEVGALADGVVVEIARVGQRVTGGANTARIAPEEATDVVAFLPADQQPSRALDPGGHALIAMTDGTRCEARLQPGHAPVRQVAPQLVGLGAPTHGWPIRVVIPDECHIGVGQAVRVSLPTP